VETEVVAVLVRELREEGSTARAIGYSRLYLREGDPPRLMSLSINQGRFERIDGRWLIAGRQSRLVGEAAAQALSRSW